MVWKEKRENLKKKDSDLDWKRFIREKIVEYAKLTKEKSYKL